MLLEEQVAVKDSEITKLKDTVSKTEAKRHEHLNSVKTDLRQVMNRCNDEIRALSGRLQILEEENTTLTNMNKKLKHSAAEIGAKHQEEVDVIIENH